MSLVCVDQGGCAGSPLGDRLLPAVCQGSPGHPLCAVGCCWHVLPVRTQCKVDSTPFPAPSPAELSPQPTGDFFAEVLPQIWQKGVGIGEQFYLGLSHQSVNVSLLSFCTQNTYLYGPVQSASLNLP